MQGITWVVPKQCTLKDIMNCPISGLLHPYMFLVLLLFVPFRATSFQAICVTIPIKQEHTNSREYVSEVEITSRARKGE